MSNQAEAAHSITARYHHDIIPAYQGNPLIEALPPIWTEAETGERLRYAPPYDVTMREAPAHLRSHLIMGAAQFFRPLPVHLALEQRFSCMVRAGYVNRNPRTAGYWPQVSATVTAIQQRRQLGQVPHITTTQGFSIVGMSGVGKSTAVRRILGQYDQVIVHERYQRQLFTHVQLTWLLLQCPRSGSLSDLVRQFFQVLDQVLGTSYYQQFVVKSKRRIEEFIPDMANLAARHSLGVLVIDEIQNLMQSRGTQAEELLNFLVEIDNVLGIPIVLIGTPKALPILMKEFRRARRATGQGDLVWERMAEDAVFGQFLKTLWGYQFTQQAAALTPELSHALYDASQGITDLVVKVYLLAQVQAIAGGLETLTPDLFAQVVADHLRLVQPFLVALRANDYDQLKRYEDIQPLYLTLDLIARMQGTLPVRTGAAVKPAAGRDVTGEVDTPVRVPAPAAHAGEDTAVTTPAVMPPPTRTRRREPPEERPLLIALYTRAVAERRPIVAILHEAGMIADPVTELGLSCTAQATTALPAAREGI